MKFHYLLLVASALGCVILGSNVAQASSENNKKTTKTTAKKTTKSPNLPLKKTTKFNQYGFTVVGPPVNNPASVVLPTNTAITGTLVAFEPVLQSLSIKLPNGKTTTLFLSNDTRYWKEKKELEPAGIFFKTNPNIPNDVPNVIRVVGKVTKTESDNYEVQNTDFDKGQEVVLYVKTVGPEKIYYVTGLGDVDSKREVASVQVK